MAPPPGRTLPGAPPWRLEITPNRGAESLGDEAVVQAVLAGERDAYRILVDREQASVVRACYRVLGNLQEAEDVAQEAFVSAYRALSTWRADGPFGAWLTRIAIRLAVRQLGRRKAIPWTRPSSGSGEAEVTGVPAGAHVEPEHIAIRAERAVAARRAVAALDEPYREVVALRFFGERSLDEIASVTGRPLSTVKTHLRRGLVRLRDHIGPGGPS